MRRDPAPSPLRYPGGKRRLFEVILQDLLSSVYRTGTYVEPFVGGGSIALAVAYYHRRCSLIINDADPDVAAFWDVVNSKDYASLVDRVLACDPTLEMHASLRRATGGTRIERAWRALFLNRTSFSGVIGASPIGGASQESKWKIGCKWNKDRIVANIVKANQLLSGRTSVTCLGWEKHIHNQYATPVTVYADPPYFDKGGMCYRTSMTEKDHKKLSEAWHSLEHPGWISYDAHDWVREHYADLNPKEIDARYSIRGNKKNWAETKELLIPSPVNT